jgi:potassium/hydrogen antiporter
VHEYIDFFPELALAAALLLAALAAVPLFERIRLPSPAAFLAVGITAGLLGVAPTTELPVVRLEQVGAVALFVILFQGGLSTGFSAARAAARPILSLGIVGTAATAGGLAVAARFALGLDWSLALLIAVALAPTDPPRSICGAPRP